MGDVGVLQGFTSTFMATQCAPDPRKAVSDDVCYDSNFIFFFFCFCGRRGRRGGERERER